MAENEKTPYDTVLEELDTLRKENEKLRKEFDELRNFNKALIARRQEGQPNTNGNGTNEKFDKYLKGE